MKRRNFFDVLICCSGGLDLVRDYFLGGFEMGHGLDLDGLFLWRGWSGLHGPAGRPAGYWDKAFFGTRVYDLIGKCICQWARFCILYSVDTQTYTWEKHLAPSWELLMGLAVFYESTWDLTTHLTWVLFWTTKGISGLFFLDDTIDIVCLFFSGHIRD